MKAAVRKLLAALAYDGEVESLTRRLVNAEAANDRLASENRSLRAEVADLHQVLENQEAEQ